MGPLIAYNGYSEDSVPVQDAIEAFNSPISSFLAGFQEGVDVTEYYSEEVGAAGSLDVVHNNVVSFLNAVAYFAQPNAGQSVSPISSVAFTGKELKGLQLHFMINKLKLKEITER